MTVKEQTHSDHENVPSHFKFEGNECDFYLASNSSTQEARNPSKWHFIFRLPSLLCTINKNRQRETFGGGQVSARLFNATTECYRGIHWWLGSFINNVRRYPASRGPSILLRRSKDIIIAGYNDGDSYTKTSLKKWVLAASNLGRFPKVRTSRPDHGWSSHFDKRNKLFSRDFAEKPSPLCLLFRIWLIWLDSFD